MSCVGEHLNLAVMVRTLPKTWLAGLSVGFNGPHYCVVGKCHYFGVIATGIDGACERKSHLRHA
jgi:hypothetical protein